MAVSPSRPPPNKKHRIAPVSHKKARVKRRQKVRIWSEKTQRIHTISTRCHLYNPPYPYIVFIQPIRMSPSPFMTISGEETSALRDEIGTYLLCVLLLSFNVQRSFLVWSFFRCGCRLIGGSICVGLRCVVCFLFVWMVVLRQPSNQKENRQLWSGDDGGGDGGATSDMRWRSDVAMSKFDMRLSPKWFMKSCSQGAHLRDDIEIGSLSSCILPQLQQAVNDFDGRMKAREEALAKSSKRARLLEER